MVYTVYGGIKVIAKLRPNQKADLFLWMMKAATYGLVFLVFFGVMAIHNPQILIPSRTMAVTMLTFATTICIMNAIYGGYAVGKKKNKHVISSLMLSVLMTDLIAYSQLQIMNVNPNKNAYFVFFSTELVCLGIGFALQVLLVILSVRIGNSVYFRMIPPSGSCIITRPDMDISIIIHKIKAYKKQYTITDIMTTEDENLVDIIKRNETVFFCGVPDHFRNELIMLCYQYKKNMMCLAELDEIVISNAKLLTLEDIPFLEMESRTMSFSQRVAKRVLDICASLIGLTVLFPVMLIASVIIALDGGSVFFVQKRVTLNGRIFPLIKLRTMKKEASLKTNHHVSAGLDDPRITPVGKVLRRFRLDEIPQLINVLKGEMSIVGPRPEMLENVEKYKKELPLFVYRERMKAGLTGYAQIEGRYNTQPNDKLMLDLMYIESFSVWLDIKLILRTFTVFFKTDSTEGFHHTK